MPSRRNGFTLIELLVVVAIITALLAILLPSVGNAVAHGQQAVCLSNQKQSGVAFHAYVSDFYVFPAYRAQENTVAANTGDDRRHHWFDQLRRRLSDDPKVPNDFPVFGCPTDERYQYDANRISFGYNYTNFGDVHYATKVQPSLQQVTRPSETLLTGDSAGLYVGTTKFWGSVISPLDINVIGGPQGAHNQYRLEARHPAGTASILFVDFHAAAHDADDANSQMRGTATPYWWDVNEGARFHYFN